MLTSSIDTWDIAVRQKVPFSDDASTQHIALCDQVCFKLVLPPHKPHSSSFSLMFVYIGNMVANGVIGYLDPHNSNRIANLSITDPFAIACFIILALMIPTAVILLTITSRRSAESVWADIENERRYRLLRRSALNRMSTASLSSANGFRHSQRSIRATTGTPQRVVFSMSPIPESPVGINIPHTPTSIMPFMTTATSIPISQRTLQSPDMPSPTSMTFSELYDRWWRGPQIEMEFADPEGRRRWTTQLTEALLRHA